MRNSVFGYAGAVALLSCALFAAPATAEPATSLSSNVSDGVLQDVVPDGSYVDGEFAVQVSTVSGSSLPHPANGLKYADSVVVVEVSKATAVQKRRLPRYPSSTSAASFSPASDPIVQPLSASGCAPAFSVYATCIDVRGTGLRVDAWNTDAYYNGTRNPTALYSRNGSIVQTSYLSNFGAGRYRSSLIGAPRFYANGDQLCNNWTGDQGGTPCIQIRG